MNRTCAQDKAKDGKRKVQQEGETSTPSNHALLIRLGPDAASSGQTFTSASPMAALHMPSVGSVSTSSDIGVSFHCGSGVGAGQVQPIHHAVPSHRLGSLHPAVISRWRGRTQASTPQRWPSD